MSLQIKLKQPEEKTKPEEGKTTIGDLSTRGILYQFNIRDLRAFADRLGLKTQFGKRAAGELKTGDIGFKYQHIPIDAMKFEQLAETIDEFGEIRLITKNNKKEVEEEITKNSFPKYDLNNETIMGKLSVPQLRELVKKADAVKDITIRGKSKTQLIEELKPFVEFVFISKAGKFKSLDLDKTIAESEDKRKKTAEKTKVRSQEIKELKETKFENPVVVKKSIVFGHFKSPDFRIEDIELEAKNEWERQQANRKLRKIQKEHYIDEKKKAKEQKLLKEKSKILTEEEKIVKETNKKIKEAASITKKKEKARAERRETEKEIKSHVAEIKSRLGK